MSNPYRTKGEIVLSSTFATRDERPWICRWFGCSPSFSIPGTLIRMKVLEPLDRYIHQNIRTLSVSRNQCNLYLFPGIYLSCERCGIESFFSFNTLWKKTHKTIETVDTYSSIQFFTRGYSRYEVSAGAEFGANPNTIGTRELTVDFSSLRLSADEVFLLKTKEVNYAEIAKELEQERTIKWIPSKPVYVLIEDSELTGKVYLDTMSLKTLRKK